MDAVVIDGLSGKRTNSFEIFDFFCAEDAAECLGELENLSLLKQSTSLKFMGSLSRLGL